MAEKNKGGRPTIYKPETVSEILRRLSNGESLRGITRDDHMPHIDTVYAWLVKHPEFSEQYARAREEQAETLADEIIALADDEPVQVVDDKGIARVDSGWVTWQKNRVDARKWVASKLKPKKYGEKITQEHTGKDGQPIAIQSANLKGLTDEELEMMKTLLEKASG